MVDGRRPTVASLHGMVAAAHPLAAGAGARILREGGNAFDAIVATAAALNVVEPFMSGLAGLGMAVCRVAAERRVRALDYMTAVPLELDAARCSADDLMVGPLASAPPGSLAGWCKLAADLGRLPLPRLLAPAITLARDGFPAGGLMLRMLAQAGPVRSAEAEWRRVYTTGDGTLPEGHVLRQPELAATLEAIASDGPGHLYGGPLGRRMVEHLRARGGAMSMADLERVAPRWVEPLRAGYRGLDVHTMPTPAESFQVLLTLRILEGFDVASMEPQGADHLDTVFRAIRLAAAARIRHNRQPVEAIARLLEDDSVATMRAQLHDRVAVESRTEKWEGDMAWPDGENREHTTSFSAADAEGNMVCITQSLGSGYGSGVVIPGTGVCMNNFLNWGDRDPASPNFLAAGGAMAMCLAPTLSLRDDGEPVLALGTPGSYGILQTTPQVLVSHVDHDLPLPLAIEAPRGRAWDGRLLHVESRVEASVVEDLRARGHDAQFVDAWTMRVGGFHGVCRDPDSGALEGAADPRRDGYAVAP
ncbi:MAG: gamma-glutamyltransferase [Ectothiorhodospiraceae bacterium]|nr:gamma-glutamyltransferase [Chromatiales bacterium]MCP5154420.1 gamma-glutamyltransferase [Ectothiorhodospiraceae bacterium]